MSELDTVEEQVFLDALECDSADEVAALLNERCAGDPELHARVLALLKHHESTGRILDESLVPMPERVHGEQPGAQPGAQTGAQPEGHEGAVVGKYTLLEQLGEGGMGVVYLARQSSPVNRMVALKIIRLGMDSRSVVARFESERQAVAMMDHPTITKILDAGTTDTGRPYFVMDLVQGTTITEFCDTHRMSLRKRLELFIQVCNGIHHAHQKGIIHRDLKPSNILVTSHDGEAMPRIIDFGIAKAVNQPLTEKTLFTSHGAMVGTPAYMSPEQAEMSDRDVDTRSDIYSLGVLLYELLTGTTPLNMSGKSYRAIQDTITQQEPECPSLRVRQSTDTARNIAENRHTDLDGLYRFIQGDLDWIIMKCLSKDRNRRYETARDLALDIRRFLTGDPVEAAAPSPGYRLKKLFAKHRVGLSAAIVVVLALLAGVVTSSIFAAQTYYAAKRARAAEELAQMRLEDARSARRDAERELDRALAAESQLAELNHQQRNRTAFYKAVAQFNPNVTVGNVGSPLSAATPARPVLPSSVLVHPGVPAVPMKSVHDLSVDRTEPRDPMQPPVVTARLGDESAVLPITRSSRSPDGNLAGQGGPAETAFLRILLEEQRREFQDDDPVMTNTLTLLGLASMRDGRYPEAIEAFQECLRIKDRLGASPLERAAAGMQLGSALSKAGKTAEARRCLTDALQLLTADEASSHMLRQAILTSLGEVAAAAE